MHTKLILTLAILVAFLGSLDAQNSSNPSNIVPLPPSGNVDDCCPSLTVAGVGDGSPIDGTNDPDPSNVGDYYIDEDGILWVSNGTSFISTEDPTNELAEVTTASAGDGAPNDGTNDPTGKSGDIYFDENGGLWISDGTSWTLVSGGPTVYNAAAGDGSPTDGVNDPSSPNAGDLYVDENGVTMLFNGSSWVVPGAYNITMNFYTPMSADFTTPADARAIYLFVRSGTADFDGTTVTAGNGWEGYNTSGGFIVPVNVTNITGEVLYGYAD